MPFTLGCDVVDVTRFGAAIIRRPGILQRLFTAHEHADVLRDHVDVYSPVAHRRYAARFAAKEAVRKALRQRGLAWQAIEIRTAADGAPLLYVNGEHSSLTVSLSHDGGVAFAVVAGFHDAPLR
jgi:holo-[acyl-carrier protein] synthase